MFKWEICLYVFLNFLVLFTAVPPSNIVSIHKQEEALEKLHWRTVWLQKVEYNGAVGAAGSVYYCREFIQTQRDKLSICLIFYMIQE